MNKNTILGFVLIAVILIGFSWYNSKIYKEQERERFVADSIARVEAAKYAAVEDSVAAANMGALGNELLKQQIADREVLVCSKDVSKSLLPVRVPYSLSGRKSFAFVQIFLMQPDVVLMSFPVPAAERIHPGEEQVSGVLQERVSILIPALQHLPLLPSPD